MTSPVKSSAPTTHILPFAIIPDGAALGGTIAAAGLGETVDCATVVRSFCSLEAGYVCDDSAVAAAATAATEESPLAAGAETVCSGWAPVPDADSFEAAVEVWSVVDPVPVTFSPALGAVGPEFKASDSSFDVSLWMLPAKALSGIGLGSTAGLPSA